MNDQKTFLAQALIDNQHEVPESIQAKMLAYLELMKEWNRVYNLTAILEPKEMIMLHLLDSLSINRFLLGSRILDVGAGAGLPGIPLALIHPEKNFTLLDSNSKKTRFLNQAKVDLQLNNLEVVHSRAEDFHPKSTFDSIVTRAFSSLKDMLSRTNHLISTPGMFLAMKGTYPEAEIQEVPEEFRVTSIHALRINGLNAERHLVCMEKT
jgi:16S rRNA (guanine527-N7)-methyltransferase